MSVTLEARCLLEFLVVELEQQVALLEVVAQVHGEAVHLAVDFGADGDLLGGAISPAALTEKLMLRNSTVAVVGRSGAAAAALAFCQFFQP